MVFQGQKSFDQKIVFSMTFFIKSKQLKKFNKLLLLLLGCLDFGLISSLDINSFDA